MPVAAKSDLLKRVRAEIDRLAGSAKTAEDLMRSIVDVLSSKLPDYNWVGFYMLDRNCEDLLVLGHSVCEPTPHVRIPLNQGICGAAAASGQTVVVDDVNSDPRYLACSLNTKSEIVAPVFVHGKVAGELDIDSHSPAAFQNEDRELVEYCAALVGRLLEKSSYAS